MYPRQREIPQDTEAWNSAKIPRQKNTSALNAEIFAPKIAIRVTNTLTKYNSRISRIGGVIAMRPIQTMPCKMVETLQTKTEKMTKAFCYELKI